MFDSYKVVWLVNADSLDCKVIGFSAENYSFDTIRAAVNKASREMTPNGEVTVSYMPAEFFA